MTAPAAPVPPTVGRRIAEWRERRGWTQRHLVELAGISVTFLSELENDKRTMGADVILRIADALGVSVDYLLKGEVEPLRPRRPLVLPPELTEAAEEKGWQLGETMDTLTARQLVMARRSRDAEDRTDRPLSKQDWIDLHDRLFQHE